MRAPEWWQHKGLLSTALLPASALYYAAHRLRMSRITPERVSVPVICVGNAVAGGAGKTPVALALGEMLKNKGHRAFFVSRGYGGNTAAPVIVNPQLHTAKEVGDEPLLLAQCLPTIVAQDRVKAARFAVAQGADIIVLDDGLQNPSLHKDYALLVMDDYGAGNGRLIPAGPLREPLDLAKARVQEIITLAPFVADTKAAEKLRWKRVLGFAGIGRPEKFRHTLTEINCDVVQFMPFPDHHAYTPRELEILLRNAKEADAVLVTTVKDYVRLPPEFRARVEALPVVLAPQNQQQLWAFVEKLPLTASR